MDKFQDSGDRVLGIGGIGGGSESMSEPQTDHAGLLQAPIVIQEEAEAGGSGVVALSNLSDSILEPLLLTFRCHWGGSLGLLDLAAAAAVHGISNSPATWILVERVSSREVSFIFPSLLPLQEFLIRTEYMLPLFWLMAASSSPFPSSAVV